MAVSRFDLDWLRCSAFGVGPLQCGHFDGARTNYAMLARLLVLFLIASSVVAAETPPAFDSMDEHALELALRALKMTPADLSFIKTNVESELVLHKASVFLQHPLAFPAYGQSVMSNLQKVASLMALARFSREQIEVSPAMVRMIYSPVPIDAEFMKKLPPPVARAVEIITETAGLVNQQLLQSLPADRDRAFAAFAVDSLGLDKDEAELKSWENLGIRPADFATCCVAVTVSNSRMTNSPLRFSKQATNWI